MTKPKPKDKGESPESLPATETSGGNGGMLLVSCAPQAHNLVAPRLSELVDELFEIVKFRQRGCAIGASLDAAKLLLALVGVCPAGLADTAQQAPGGIHLYGDGSVQINKGDGPDKLTQELIDIVRKGNNGKGKGKT